MTYFTKQNTNPTPTLARWLELKFLWLAVCLRQGQALGKSFREHSKDTVSAIQFSTINPLKITYVYCSNKTAGPYAQSY